MRLSFILPGMLGEAVKLPPAVYSNKGCEELPMILPGRGESASVLKSVFKKTLV